MNRVIQSVVFIAVSSLPLIINYFLKMRYKKLIDELKTESETDYYHQCIFINMRNFDCKQHLINREECSEHCSYARLQTIVNFVSSAKKSICLCMYTLTLKQVNLALIKAHQNGVNVRVITDKVMVKTDVSKFNFSKLKEKGVPYKVQLSEDSMMHHKFCLIDKEDRNNAKLFFGSLNLTSQGLVSNFDNVVLTNNLDVIQRYSEEFEELWEDFHFE